MQKYLPGEATCAHTHTHTPAHTRYPLPKLDETVDQTPGCAQMRRSLCTVALDLAVCPHGPDTRLKLNYRLVAPGPKRGLFGWPLSEKSSFSNSGTGKKKKKNVMGFKEENVSLGDIFFHPTVSAGASGPLNLECLQRLLKLTL